MRVAKFIYSTIVTAVLVGCYFATLAVLGIDITNELQGLGVALWFLAYHYAGIEFQLIDFSDNLVGRPQKDDNDDVPPPPSVPAV